MAALALALLVGVGCGNPTPPAQPASFDRPESVAFFCWDLAGATPVALAECAPGADAEVSGEPPEGLALHALVTQTATGEVAAVRLTGDTERGEPGVIDSDVRVPGFTFVAVGEVPSAVVVPRSSPGHVYTLSRGSADLRVVRTADFRTGLGTTVTVYSELLPAGSRPSDMILTPGEDALLVALPAEGQLVKIPLLADGALDEAAAQFLDLGSEVPAPVDLTAVPEPERPPGYLYTCAVSGEVTEPTPVPPREPVSLGATPEPWSLLLDPETGQVLVADRALPIVHRVDPVELTLLEPLGVSVPTRQLALTPRVPARVGDVEPTERFLYALDQVERTVLAIDYSDPARGSFGAVLPVSVSAPVDRLETPLPARAIEVVSPAYDAQAPIELCQDAGRGELASSVDLHGVFLTVGTVDGRIRFFDVFDRDTACRGESCAVGANPSPDDQVVAIGRHRPRIGGAVQETVQITPEPSWTTAAAGAVAVGPDGRVEGGAVVPSLVPVGSCPEPLGPVWPAPAQGGADAPLVCAVTDPWAAVNQSFSATWQARIPFTATTGGNLDADEPLLESRSDYCALGVLGSRDVPEDGPLAGYPGDIVAITADLPPSILQSGDDALITRCEELTQRTVAGTTTPILLPILEAFTAPEDGRETYPGRLAVGEPIEPAGFTLDDVRTCYPELLSFEVRARGAFVVQSTRGGFEHPVVRGEGGSCEVDPARVDALQRGRAFCGQPFRGPEIAFSLGECPDAISDAALQLTVGNVPPPLTIDVGSIGGTDRSSLLTRLEYNDVDQRLYAVDQSAQGLVRIRLTDLAVQQTFR